MKTHPTELTNKQARHFLLAHQGLWPPKKLLGKRGILEYIHHVGSIQFDPLNVIGYNPDLVLQARINNYKEKDLQELLYKDRKLLDGWDKKANNLLIKNWWWEQDVSSTSTVQKALAECFGQFLKSAGANGMKICKEKGIEPKLNGLKNLQITET